MLNVSFFSIDQNNQGLKLSGILDSTTCAEFESKVNQNEQLGKHNIIIDLAELSYISSAGLRSLTMLFKSLASNKKKLALLHPQELVKEVISVSGFIKLMPIYTSLQEAQSDLA